ncbi:tigger transposable element-derived protein 2-like [Apostichopus japonicus]|uniref:tigger transposable element-derived protein 2-like n=1 Tax=Stichopus japonicus TaxID=307972 RepID=UPI003AB6B93D
MRPQKRKLNEDSGGPSNKKSKWKEIDLSIPTREKRRYHHKRHVCNKPQSQESQLTDRKKKLALFTRNYRREGMIDQDPSKPRIERIRTALEGLSSGKYSTIHEAASANGVHYDQIQRRAIGNVKWYRRNGPKPYLTLGEERHLARWVVTMGNRGFPVSPKQLKDTVQELITKDGRSTPFRSGRPSNGWYTGFLKRNPSIQLKPTKTLNKARAKVTKQAVDDWFRNFNCFISDLNLTDKPGLIYNFDETGFGLSGKPPRYALGSRHMKGALPQMTSSEGKKQITVGVCANADGKLLPPYFLFKGTRPNSWDPLAGAPPKSVAYFTESGWMTQTSFQYWFQNQFVQNIGNERPLVLLLDSHEGHIAYDLFQTAEESNIHLYRFLPNATHFLQPLDVGVFGHMKRSYWDYLRKWVARNPGETITQRNVSRIIGNIWEDLERPGLIRKSFLSSGIFPVNRAAVTDEMTMPSLTFREETTDTECADKVTTNEASPETTVHMPTTPDAQRAVSLHLTKATELPSVKPQKKARRRLCNELPYDVTSPTAIDTMKEHLLSKCRSKARKELLAKKKHFEKKGIENLVQKKKSQEFRCPICGGKYEEKVKVGWVGCDTCNQWYHMSCMPKALVTAKMLRKKEWCCPNCK